MTAHELQLAWWASSTIEGLHSALHVTAQQTVARVWVEGGKVHWDTGAWGCCCEQEERYGMAYGPDGHHVMCPGVRSVKGARRRAERALRSACEADA